MERDVTLVPYSVEVFKGDVTLIHGFSYLGLVVRVIAVCHDSISMLP
jgi:hypothetical protein